MPYDDRLATRMRTILSPRKGFVEKKMFGGIGFLLNGNLCCCAWKEFLILRIGPEAYADALAQPAVREFDVTGRPMTGWVMVEPEGCGRDEDLRAWVERALQFVRTLPAKE
jgi:hypothetical protein